MTIFRSITMAHAATIARDAAGVGAVASISIGAGMVYPPAGFIVAGLLVLAGVIAAARSEGGEHPDRPPPTNG